MKRYHLIVRSNPGSEDHAVTVSCRLVEHSEGDWVRQVDAVRAVKEELVTTELECKQRLDVLAQTLRNGLEELGVDLRDIGPRPEDLLPELVRALSPLHHDLV